MASWQRSGAIAFAALLLGGVAAEAAEGTRADLVNRSVLRVCADPANLPFSSDDPEKPGFENKIAEIVAEEMGGIAVEHTWFPQATGFIRRTLSSKVCDLVVGFAQGDELVLNTNHYYRSAYALVFKKNAAGFEGIDQLSDARLKGKRIGIVAGTPPATVMNRAGLLGSAKPYHLFVDRRYDSPAELMVKDIRSGDIDAGILWGPNAGYFASQGGKDDLAIVPLLKEGRQPPMTFRITMGVRQSDIQWKRELNDIIKKRQGDIDQVLLDFKVPIIDEKDQLITSARK
ncbi:MAG: quinoprotein dehydrogenase-associated putative ABC transporter substrate-binding protein [Alphaproteobacteria bacterium]|nr:quinoprotein dehydrogenase-associated putative ABC transporter substrate-binding protein [Alphaproteobacteria bacterium]